MTVRLGLIGDNIRQSRAPALHRICGRLTGQDVSYELLIPGELGHDFAGTLAHCREHGFHGVNVTLPYKEQAFRAARPSDPLVAHIGAVNTLVFGDGQLVGHNTDQSGFVGAWRAEFGDAPPGRVRLIGAGGAGKAVAFALLSLGAERIELADTDNRRAADLADAINAAGGANGPAVAVAADSPPGSINGIANCTPIGMTGYPGSPVREGTFPNCDWAFDAVYTPMHTLFRAQAEAAGARFLSGYELHFWQGVHAFEIFTGRRPPDLDELRRLHLAETGAL